MEKLDKKIISDELGESLLSENIILYDNLDSTNKLAKELAINGAQEGTIIIAEEQTAGRGRMDRKWLSSGYNNILLSIILRPEISIDKLFTLTMILAISVCDVVKEECEIIAMIKWPNDIYVENKKIAGILTEFSVSKKKIDYAVVGIGINVNWKPEKNDALLYPATSLLNETKKKWSRNILLVKILKAFEKNYKLTNSNKIEGLYKRWNELSMVLGKEVDILSEKESIKGRAVRIDEKGSLVIVDNKQNEKVILSGDVSLRYEI